MKNIFFTVAVFIIVTGCNHTANNKIVPAPIPETKAKKDSFFPVTSFLKGQMIGLDSLSVTPLHTTTVNNKTDSVWLKKKQLAPLLGSFLSPEIKETNLTSLFKETSFNDQTLNAITFTYDPLKSLPDSVSLRHWDVYVAPETGQVMKVYMVKQSKQKDSLITQQLTWKTNKFATIVTILNKPGGNDQLLKEEKFTWDFN